MSEFKLLILDCGWMSLMDEPYLKLIVSFVDFFSEIHRALNA